MFFFLLRKLIIDFFLFMVWDDDICDIYLIINIFCISVRIL